MFRDPLAMRCYLGWVRWRGPCGQSSAYPLSEAAVNNHVVRSRRQRPKAEPRDIGTGDRAGSLLLPPKAGGDEAGVHLSHVHGALLRCPMPVFSELVVS